MKVYIDTNILVDLIADRKPYSKFAIEIFSKAEKKQIQLYCSSHSFATTHYLLKKYISEIELREILLNVLEFIKIIPVDMDNIKKGLRSVHKDFEDAIQINCASSISKLKYIVTRNPKDFKKSEIPVISPDEFILKYNKSIS
jgi:predicted nucleic acid-binding protein